MDILPFLAVLLILAIPFLLLGWWLVRWTRYVDHLAKVMDANNAELGQLRLGHRTHGWMLFADVRFVLFLVLRRYRHLELPPVVEEALETARTDYLTGVAAFTTLVVVAFGFVIYSEF